MNKSAYQRIMRASVRGRGVRLSLDEVYDLAMDGAIETRATLDDAFERCVKRGYHRSDSSGLCNQCERDATEGIE